MPYDIQLPDGTLVDNIPDNVDPVEAKARILKAYPELALTEKRTWGEAGKDILASVGSGIGSLAQFPGQVYGLVTGDMDKSGLQELGRKLETYSQEAKSPVIRAKEAARSQKIAQTEGFFSQAGTAIAETLKDPSLLSSFIFEQAPQLLGTMGGGYVTKQGVKALMRNATEEVLAKSGTRGAISTGAVMQGADVGTDTYERIYSELIMQGYPEEKAREEALAGGRKAAVEAAALTMVTSVGPGGTIERALTRGAAGAPKTGILKGTIGEMLGEAVEEGGGQLASNIEFLRARPEADIMEGVGAATGLGALGGGLFGLPASFVNKANALELERAKKMVEDAKKRAAESNQPQEVQLQLGYDPTVEGSGIYTPIIVNPDGTTTFPSERNQFAQVVPGELSEEGFAEKYGIPTEAQLKDRTFTAETIKGFGISPKANLYKNLEILDKDIANPENAKKIKAELQAYLAKYPKVNPKIRKNIMDYLARPEFQEKPTFPTQVTSATTTPQADEAAIQQRLIEGFKNRPEIQKIYEDYNKLMAEQDADKAALSAFNSVLTPQTIKSLGFKYGSQPFNDQELVNADLTNPEVADMVRAKLTALRDQTKSKTIKENIDRYLNRTEFITPSFVDQYLNPPRTEAEQNMEHFVFLNNEGNIESKYGTIYEKNGKKYAKYADNKGQKGGERELTENVFVNPTPDQIELLSLYKSRDQLMKEPDDFKSWLIKRGVDPKERADIGIEKRLPHKMFREGGYSLDDLIRMAIEDGILHEPDFREGVGGIESMRDYIKMAVEGDFVPTSNNMRNMNDLENLQRQIEYLESKVKGVPEEAVAEEFREPTGEPPKAPEAPVAPEDTVTPEVTEEAPKKPRTAKSVIEGMEAKIAEGKNQSREGLTPDQLEVLDMADVIEKAGQPGFANAMRQNVLQRTPLTIQNMEFYRNRRDQYLAEQGKGKEPIAEEYDINKFVEGYDADRARLQNQYDLFGTEATQAVDKANQYIQRLAKAINDRGFRVTNVNSFSPREVVDLKSRLTNIATGVNRVMKQSQALNKGYKRANEDAFRKSLEDLNEDFAKAEYVLSGKKEALNKVIDSMKQNMVRFASGMSGLSDLIRGSKARARHKNYGIGFDVGLLSKNAIDHMAHYIVNLDTQVFVDSGAFSNFRKMLRGQEVSPLDFDKILEKYDAILEAISNENASEKQDYPRPYFVMPDVVGDQKASLDLLERYKNWISTELTFNQSKPIIPLQKGELSLSEAYRKIQDILNINEFIVGIPANEKAISKEELSEFLRTIHPSQIHFLGAASDSKLNPLLEVVAMDAPNTKITADASKVRSAILNAVAKGKTRDEAIMDALHEEEDPMVLMDKYGEEISNERPSGEGTLQSQEANKTDTSSSEFKKWFEGSKVVNKDGSPRVMYHGTNQDINKFFNNQFFAYSPKDANSYAFKNFYNNELVPNEESEDIAGANVTPVYIKAKKIATPDDVINLVKKMGIYNDRELDSFLYTSAYDESYVNRANRVIAELKKQGFDAINHYDYDLRGNPISSLQVFEPNQIKSIYNKKPTEAEGISESKEEGKAYTNKAFNISKEDQRIEKEISGKTLQELSDWTIKNAPNQFARVIASMVNKRIKQLSNRGIKLDFVLHTGGTRQVSMYGNKGHVSFDFTGKKPSSMTLNLNGAAVVNNQRGYPSGMNYTTILHELLHVATSGQLFMRSKQDPLVVELSDLRNQVVKYYNEKVDKKELTPFMERIHNNQINALRNIDELVSWGLTDKDMQAFLSEIKVGEKTAFSKLVQLVREILGINKDYESALDRLIRTSESILNEDINVIGDRVVSRGYSFGEKPAGEEKVSGQGTLFQQEMKASFEGVDEAYADAIRKQFTQEDATVEQKFNNLKKNFFDRMVTGLFDEFRAIKKYTTEGYMMARLSKSIDGGLQGLLEHGQVFLNDGALDIRPGTKGLLEILEPLGAEVDQYQIWKALSRDAQMAADKRSFDPALVAGRDKLTQGTIDGKSRKEVYEKARMEENALNKSVLDVALETGLIDRQAYQVFSNDINYIPFYKMMEDGDVNSVSASSKLTGQYFSKALKGGEKKTNDLMENVLLNWSHILSASMKNQAALKTVQAAESMGAAEKAKPMDGKYPEGTIKLMEDGKLTHYTLTDPDLVDAISTISYLGPKSAFLNVAKGFTNALRYGVTLSPAYKVRNLIRDSLQSASVSELGANMFENVYNGLRMSRKGDPTFMAALAGGGIFEMGTAHEGDQARLIKRLIDKGVREATILDTPEKIKGKLQDLLDSYNELGNKFENANRLALYRKLRDSGKTHLEASFASRDLMDFSMQGQFRAIKVIGSVVPFFNARLQGLYKLGRDGISPTYRVICNATTGKELQIGDKEKAQRFMVMASAIALASIALYGMYKDDEDFQRREDWDRDNFWWFKIGGTIFRIPKPFEIGAFGTIAERTFEQIADENVEGKVFAQRLNAILMDTFSLNPVPQMIKPMIDLYANKDSFTGAPIESAGMERLSKQERQTDKTSGIAKALGGVSAAAHKVLTFNPDAEGFSPVQMDYAVKAYLGWMGATAVSTADMAVEPFTEGTRVRKPVIDTLAMGFIKTEPETQSKYMTQFYQNNARLQSALADMRHYAEIGDMDKVTQILEEKGDDIALSKVYDKATKQLAELRKQSRRIEQDKDISTDDKRAEMNRIRILMSDIAKEMETIRKTR